MQISFSGPKHLARAIKKSKPRKVSRSRYIALLLCGALGIPLHKEPRRYPAVRNR
jgi:hypothetical protein